MSAYSLCSLLISPPSLLCFNSVYATVCPGISLDLRGLSPAILSYPLSSFDALHRPRASALPGPIVCEHRTRSGESTPSLSVRVALPGGEESARLHGFPPFTPKSIDRMSLLSLRADKRERPEPSWPLDVSTYIRVIYNM